MAVAVAEFGAILVVVMLLLQSRAGSEVALAPATGEALPATEVRRQAEVLESTDPAERAPPAAEAVIAGDDAIGLVLQGIVGAAGGTRPVVRAQLQLSRDGGGEARRAVLAEPNFAFAGLTAGTWKLRVMAAGFEPYERDVTLAGGPRVQQHDVELVAAMVVKVALLAPDGAPLLQVEGMAGKLVAQPIEVVATEGEAPELLAAALPPSRSLDQTRASWRPSGVGLMHQGPQLPKRFAGELTLRQPPPVWVSAYLGVRRLATAHFPAMQDEVVLTVDPAAVGASFGTVTFRVVAAEDRAALPAAHASLSSRFAIRPDPSGVVKVGDLGAGRYELSVTAPARAQHGVAFELAPGQTLDLGEIALAAAGEVWRGTVVDAAGKPAAARIRLRAVDGVDAWLGVPPGPAATTDAAGAFALEGLRAVRYLALASDDRNQQMAFAVLDASGPRAPLALRLQLTATLRVTTRLTGLASLRVLLRDDAGQPISGHVLSAGQTLPLRLPPGSYRLEVSTAPGHTRMVPVALAADGGEVVLE